MALQEGTMRKTWINKKQIFAHTQSFFALSCQRNTEVVFKKNNGKFSQPAMNTCL